MSFNFVIPQFNINGAGTPPLQFFRRGFNLNGSGGSQPSWKDIILHGVTALTLVNAKAGGLNYLKLFGGTEQRNLPVGYTEYSDIRNTSANSSNQIDLDIIDDVDDMVYELEVENPSVGSWYILQSRESGDQNICGISGSQNGNYISAGARGTSLTAKNGSDYVVRNGTGHYFVRFVHKNGAQSLTVTDLNTGTVYTDSNTYTYIAATVPLCLFSNNVGNYVATGNKVKHIRIYKSGVLARDLYPANDGTKGGMYDNASNRMFLPTAQNYIALDDLAVPSPDTPMDIVCNNGALKVNSQGQVYTDGTVETVQTRLKGLTPDEFFGAQATITKRVGLFSYEFSYSPASSATWNGIVKAGLNIIEGHKYYYCAEISSSAQSILTITFTNALESATRNKATVEPNTTYLLDKISTATVSNSNDSMYIRCGYTGLGDYTGSAYNIGLFDLTEMFGAGNEPTTTEQARQALFFGTVTAEMLLAIGSYQDIQSVLDGEVTRQLGIKVLNGTEEGWIKANNSFSNATLFADKKIEKRTVFCTHFKYDAGSTANIPDMCVGCASTSTNTYFRYDALSTVEQWKQFLADQYNAGTPVIVVYLLAEPTTDSVTPQSMTIQAGTNVVEITQASMDHLPLEVSYKGRL